MVSEPASATGPSEIEKLLLSAGQLQFNIEVLKANLQSVNQRINDIQHANAPQPTPEVAPEQA